MFCQNCNVISTWYIHANSREEDWSPLSLHLTSNCQVILSTKTEHLKRLQAQELRLVWSLNCLNKFYPARRCRPSAVFFKTSYTVFGPRWLQRRDPSWFCWIHIKSIFFKSSWCLLRRVLIFTDHIVSDAHRAEQFIPVIVDIIKRTTDWLSTTNSKNPPRDCAGDDTEKGREYLKVKSILEGFQTPVALSNTSYHILCQTPVALNISSRHRRYHRTYDRRVAYDERQQREQGLSARSRGRRRVGPEGASRGRWVWGWSPSRRLCRPRQW